jgi:flagellar biosynthetic protein FlhB
MSGDNDADRTESATPRRRKEARKEGQVARSSEVNSTLVLLAGVSVVAVALTWMGQRLYRVGVFFFEESSAVSLESPADALVFIELMIRQTVGVFSLQALSFKAQKLNPVEGAKRLVSKQMLFELSKNLLKVLLLATVAILAIRPVLPELLGLMGLDLVGGWLEGGRFLWKLILRMIAVLAVLAIADWWWQRHRYEEQMKMTKEEVKREHKDAEGDPQVRARIRSMMLEAARRRMMDDVRTADVVVTNPTHFSVALSYDRTGPAPKVVAKGQGFLALRIREVAREAGIPVVEEAPLARALYRAVKVGGFIPTDLFEAVARVLAAVYRADRRRAAQAGA